MQGRFQIHYRPEGSEPGTWLDWHAENDARQVGYEVTALLLGTLKDADGKPIKAAEVSVTDTAPPPSIAQKARDASRAPFAD